MRHWFLIGVQTNPRGSLRQSQSLGGGQDTQSTHMIRGDTPDLDNTGRSKLDAISIVVWLSWWYVVCSGVGYAEEVGVRNRNHERLKCYFYLRYLFAHLQFSNSYHAVPRHSPIRLRTTPIRSATRTFKAHEIGKQIAASHCVLLHNDSSRASRFIK